MEAKARLLGHPVHQMLIVFPLGLLATSLIFDVLQMLAGRPQFAAVAYWLIVAGVISGLVAAVFGFIDFLIIPRRTRAKRIGALHGVGNVIVTGLFFASAVLRAPDPILRPPLALGLSLVAVVLAVVTGWMGGELVDRLSVGVDDGANVNAPSSLKVSHLPAPKAERIPELVGR